MQLHSVSNLSDFRDWRARVRVHERARAHKSCDSCAWGSGVCARVVLESSKAAAVKSRNLT